MKCRNLSGNKFSKLYHGICHGREYLHLEPSCGLDVAEYMSNYVFCAQIFLEIEFKRRV